MDVFLMTTKQFEQYLKVCPKKVLKAARAAAGRAATSGQKACKEGITKVSHLKKADIRDAVKKPRIVSKSNISVEYEFNVNGDVIGLDRFKLKPRRITARKGLRSTKWETPAYQVGPNEPWHRIKRHGRASAGFLAKVRSYSKMMFFRRFGPKLVRTYGVTPQYFAAFDDLADRYVLHKVTETFNGRFEHELYYHFGKRMR